MLDLVSIQTIIQTLVKLLVLVSNYRMKVNKFLCYGILDNIYLVFILKAFNWLLLTHLIFLNLDFHEDNLARLSMALL